MYSFGGAGVSWCVVVCGSVIRFGAVGEDKWGKRERFFAVNLEERGVRISGDEWTACRRCERRGETLCVCDGGGLCVRGTVISREGTLCVLVCKEGGTVCPGG